MESGNGLDRIFSDVMSQIDTAINTDWRERLPEIELHDGQKILQEEARQVNIVNMGRRFGKSFFGKYKVVESVSRGHTIGWYAPVQKSMEHAWTDILEFLSPIVSYKNEQKRIIRCENGAEVNFWSLTNSDSSRGYRYNRVIIDEGAYVPKLEYAWSAVIAPTLIDYNGDAWILSTPNGKGSFYHKMWLKGQEEENKFYKSWTMPTTMNTTISKEGIEFIKADLSGNERTLKQEFYAEFLDDTEGALWTMETIDVGRVTLESEKPTEWHMVCVSIDPAVSTGNTGITVVASAYVKNELHCYILESVAESAVPDKWGAKAIELFHKYEASFLVYERNQGGLLVEQVLKTKIPNIPVLDVYSANGKIARATPIAVLYQQGRVHHVGVFRELEHQMTTFTGKGKSPDLMDSMVWGVTKLMGYGIGSSKETTLMKLNRPAYSTRSDRAGKKKGSVGIKI